MLERDRGVLVRVERDQLYWVHRVRRNDDRLVGRRFERRVVLQERGATPKSSAILVATHIQAEISKCRHKVLDTDGYIASNQINTAVANLLLG